MGQEYKVSASIEMLISLGVVAAGLLIIILFLKKDWKRFGSLYVLSAIVGLIICELFVLLRLYWFPSHLFPSIFKMPVVEVTLSFPAMVLLAVNFSPKRWPWKLPFYWAIVHLGLLAETWLLVNTTIIKYSQKWHLWESYTWWWIYFLIFEWIGGLLIPLELRNPLSIRHLRYGKLGWAILHLILILTIFLGGYYMGTLSR